MFIFHKNSKRIANKINFIVSTSPKVAFILCNAAIAFFNQQIWDGMLLLKNQRHVHSLQHNFAPSFYGKFPVAYFVTTCIKSPNALIATCHGQNQFFLWWAKHQS